MYSDYHLHSHHSFDSDEKPKNILDKCISLGMDECCITDHNDFNWPIAGENFTLDTGKYFKELSILRENYSKKIKLRIGLEVGMTLENITLNEALINSNTFDFVIGSVHIVDGKDPYYPEFFQDRSDKEALTLYFNEMKDNLDAFGNFDVLGHMDYVIRYSPNGDRHYSLYDYTDIIDYILKKIIENGKGLEVNTSSLKSAMDVPNPCPAILKRYKELGGEIITVGSDAHKAQHIAYAFDQIGNLLRVAGFDYYTVFNNRKPEFKPL